MLVEQILFNLKIQIAQFHFETISIDHCFLWNGDKDKATKLRGILIINESPTNRRRTKEELVVKAESAAMLHY